jgi:hypothetical protein
MMCPTMKALLELEDKIYQDGTMEEWTNLLDKVLKRKLQPFRWMIPDTRP